MAVLGAIVLLLLGGALAVKSILSGTGKDKIVAALSNQLGVKLKVGSIDADLPKVLSMTPALSLGGIELSNPPGFSAAPMVIAERIDARVELSSIFSGAPRIIALDVLKPVVSIEKNAAGQTNLQAFLDGMNRKAAPATQVAGPKAESSSVAIEDLLIAGGAIKTAGQPLGSWGEINLKLNGFGTGRPLKAVGSAVNTGGHQARLEFLGDMGPFAGPAMPVDGRLRVSAAPLEKAKLDLDVALKGDLETVAEGPAKLVVTDYPIGSNAQRTLPLNGQAAGTLTVKQAAGGDPVFQVLIPKASLSLAGGKVDSRIELSSAHGTVTGALAGGLGGLRIEQLLGAFAVNNPGVQGGLTMPRFQFRFAGANSDQIRESVSGDGSLSVDRGKLPQMDLLGAITGALGQTGVVTTSGSTEFATLKTDFLVTRQVLTLSNLQMEGAGLHVSGGGTVAMNRSLNFKLNTVVGGQVAGLLGARPRGSEPAQANVPISVTGTVENPTVMPNVQGLAGEAAVNYLDGVLNKYLGGKKK